MFSPTELDNVAWFLLLLMGAWLVVNAVVDLSRDRAHYRDPRKSTEDRSDQRD